MLPLAHRASSPARARRVAVWLVVALLALGARQPPDHERLFDVGYEAYHRRDYATAARYLAAYIRHAPGSYRRDVRFARDVRRAYEFARERAASARRPVQQPAAESGEIGTVAQGVETGPPRLGRPPRPPVTARPVARAATRGTLAGVGGVAPAAAAPAPAAAMAGVGAAERCVDGFVWREAVADDRVCVGPAARAQAAEENRAAAERRAPAGGAYGPDSCRPGYVWREATPGDRVCVTPARRDEVAAETARAATRRRTP